MAQSREESYWTLFPKESGCSPLPDFWTCRFEKETKPKVSARKSWRLRSVGVCPVKRYAAVIPPSDALAGLSATRISRARAFRVLRAMAAHGDRFCLRRRGLREAAGNRSLSCRPERDTLAVPSKRDGKVPADSGRYCVRRSPCCFLSARGFCNVPNGNLTRLAATRAACYPPDEAMQIGDRP